MAQAITPVDLTIIPRDRRFGRGQDTSRWWMGGDPVATAFHDALSSIFPKGEAFVVESVRAFREGASPKLAGEKGVRDAGSDALGGQGQGPERTRFVVA